MKGYTFYLEYPSQAEKRKATRKHPGNHSGNVIATFGTWFTGGSSGAMIECVSAVYEWPNSAVCSSSVSISYIRERCKRISEAQAREIHPRLFDYLDMNN